MLKLKYLVENFDLARMALQLWPHDEATLAERMRYFRISANAVYPYECNGKLCFLRLCPAEEKTLPLIREELRFLSLIREAGCPAMRPIPSLNGECFRHIRSPWGVWYACAFEGVPGVPLEQVELTEEVITRYGEALGQLHRASMDIVIPPARPNFLDLLKWSAAILEDAPYAIFRECRDVRDELLKLPRGPFAFGMIHGDFELDNVFWDGEGCQVIDFDDCMVHFYALDVVIALDELAADAQEAFLRGYRSACPEARIHTEDFPLLRRFRDVYQYARIMHALSERPEEEPDWMPALVSRLEGRMNAIGAKIQQERKARKKRPWDRA
ncbi:MAG: hypothetical protein E7318_09685 [Clostridiales bacterium]|nr:hypothetical protein [Clostridiales bacterium]